MYVAIYTHVAWYSLFLRYEWFCHIDDDVYVNIIQLSWLLQQYNPHNPHYLGKWASKPWGTLHRVPVSVVVK